MSDKNTAAAATTFRDLQLCAPLLQALDEVGYESPSPIQAETIPPLLAGKDLLGQAQTGTGKTAAFALPALERIDLEQRAVQVLVLAPTRELAIQVAEAFQRYAKYLRGFHVLPIYGGQGYNQQLAGLRRGAHVVVGTPGRVMDHIKRNTLQLDQLKCVVLDEADEMLRMGFIEDVEWILQHTPTTRQTTLFSATMPSQVRRIAQAHLKAPVEITIRSKTTTAASIRQRYWQVSGVHKLDALTRILETENFDAMLIFARTKISTEELATRLEARGFAAAALNGDIPQQQRERTVARLREGQLDILVATDVAARGLNVERISHVVNYDIPLDIESYVHRIGRTGRAGRSGEAILFVAPRERRMLAAIERATRQPIERMDLPTVEAVNNQRIGKFKATITATLEANELELFRTIIEQYEQEHNVPAIEIAAALAKMAQGKTPLVLPLGTKSARDEGLQSETTMREPERKGATRKSAQHSKATDELASHQYKAKPSGRERKQAERAERFATRPDFSRDSKRTARPRALMETFRIEVGRTHQVQPSNIVGAIANEAGIDSKHIGRIEILEDHSLVDLPEGMPKEILRHLKKVWVSGREMKITAYAGAGQSKNKISTHMVASKKYAPERKQKVRLKR